MPARGHTLHDRSTLRPHPLRKRSRTLATAAPTLPLSGHSQSDSGDDQSDSDSVPTASTSRRTLSRPKRASVSTRERRRRARQVTVDEPVAIPSTTRTRRNSLPRPPSPRRRITEPAASTSTSRSPTKTHHSHPLAHTRSNVREKDASLAVAAPPLTTVAPLTQHATRTHHHHPATRPSTGKILSALPVNHTVARSTQHTAAMASKRARDPDSSAAVVVAPRMTRRASGQAQIIDAQHVRKTERATSVSRGRKRKRVVTMSTDSEDEVDNDDDEQDEGGDDVEMEEDVAPAQRTLRPPRRRPGTRAHQESDAEQEKDGEGDDQDEGEQDGEELGEDERYKIYDASIDQLRRLGLRELRHLYALAPANFSDAGAELESREDYVQGLLKIRSFVLGQHDHADSSPESNEDASPRPFTSHEASPVADTRSRKGTSNNTRRRGERNKSRTRRERHVPTPPPSSKASSDSALSATEAEESDGERTNTRVLRGRSHSLPSLSQRPVTELGRRSRRSQVDVTAEADLAPRRQLRNRRGSTLVPDSITEKEDRGHQLRSGKTVSRPSPKGKGKTVKFDDEGGVVQEEDDEEQEEEEIEQHPAALYTSPVAHRTRHGGVASSSPVQSPNSRPNRAAKSKAVERIVKTRSGSKPVSRKGKERALDEDDEDGSDGGMGNDDEEDEEGDADMIDVDEEDPETARRRSTHASARRRRSGRGVKQVETPPSDESGAEPDDEHSADEGDEDEDDDINSESEVSFELTSHLRGPRQLRNGKVVALKDVAEEDDVLPLEEEVEEDEEEEDEPMYTGEGDEEVDLANATSKSLLRHRRDDLIRLCEEREIHGEGTKKELVQALLEWRDQDFDASSGSSDSTASVDSNATARAETKTQALAAAERTSVRGSTKTPLLMRAEHSSSPEKPRTPRRSKRDEQEEVNALDLASLQLQDREIAPEKLTKLEMVGSGGFKDVYKGIYRKKTIAICDIRGHLTEMDIKELGLLRDLRHDNIVHFIGVSIPKEPSTVPVMIVTELCANGDLFDYLRGVPHPPFLRMLEMMLDIAKGVDYLHTRKPTIIHRDIKSSNVLITAQGVAKLGDFGLSFVKTSAKAILRSVVGTVNWQAPELWVPHPRYNEKVDVYSVGLVFWEILQWHQPVKRYPFEGLNEHAIYDQVGHKKIRPSTASMRRQWGGEVIDVMSAMWDQDSAARPPMSQVVLELGVLITSEKSRLAEEKRAARS